MVFVIDEISLCNQCYVIEEMQEYFFNIALCNELPFHSLRCAYGSNPASSTNTSQSNLVSLSPLVGPGSVPSRISSVVSLTSGVGQVIDELSIGVQICNQLIEQKNFRLHSH